MSRTVIVGANGQDGRLLREQLQEDSTDVVPLGRGDLDLGNFRKVSTFVGDHQPAEIFYLAAHHHSSEDKLGDDVGALLRRSFDLQVTSLIHFLEAIRTASPATRLFYAASSHVFGSPDSVLQDESTPMNPICPYGISKVAGTHSCRFYRDTHGVFASVGFLYNHESPFRRPEFVTRKIVSSAVSISRGQREKLTLGDLSARIDWGYAPDYVDAMRRILALPSAGDYVIATGRPHSVGDFVERAFSCLELDWRDHVVEDPAILTKQQRILAGDSTKLFEATGWKPSISFEKMIEILVEAECNRA